jgi:hypothetical protein
MVTAGRCREWFSTTESEEIDAKAYNRVNFASVMKEAKVPREPWSQIVNKYSYIGSNYFVGPCILYFIILSRIEINDSYLGGHNSESRHEDYVFRGFIDFLRSRTG